MKVSFIVSSFERPISLMTCVTSLINQVAIEKEIIVIDNSNDPLMVSVIKETESINSLIKVINTKGLLEEPQRNSCYEPSMILGFEQSVGEWLCFPNDDSYYVPGFATVMVNTAERFNWDFVYCNMVYDPRWDGKTYSVVPGYPIVRYITKSSFIIRRHLFEKYRFPPHEYDYRDYALADALVKDNVRMGCAPGVLHFTN